MSEFEYTDDERLYDIIKLMVDVLREVNYESLMCMVYLMQGEYLTLHRTPLFNLDFETGPRVPELELTKWLSNHLTIEHKTLVNVGTPICYSVNKLDRLFIKEKTKEYQALKKDELEDKVCKSVAWNTIRLKGIGLPITKQAIYASYVK